ncbi:hypothetical protein [Terricaulis sp.]|uniref:hypothetical protein n=1 Tax=Terricaulis sp. TaxID=2768686 RepID=UPI00378413F1
MKKFLAAAAIFVALATPAAAQPTSRGFTGVWAIQTQDYSNSQGREFRALSGTMIISRNGRSYSADLVAHTMGAYPGEWPTTARETCTARTSGNRISITCAIVSHNSENGYDPDNFELTLDGDEMRGQLIYGGQTGALFTRVR